MASTSFLLVRKDQTSEIRLHGFKMLQVKLESVFVILLIGIVWIALAISSIKSVHSPVVLAVFG